MLVVFSTIFVADSKIISCHDFVAPLNKQDSLLAITSHVFVSFKAFMSPRRPRKEYVFISTLSNSLKNKNLVNM